MRVLWLPRELQKQKEQSTLMSLAKPPRLSPPEATRKIRLILQEGTIDFSAHCWLKRMLERNVSTLDVEHVLGQGRVIREAEWDSDRCNWKYPAGTRTGMINCARRDEYK
jgi:hypothetical protein